MPERPELDYQVPILRDWLVGRSVVGVRVEAPVVLRMLVEGDVRALLPGRTIERVERRAHFVLFGLGDLELAVAPMLAGRFSRVKRGARRTKDTAFVLELDGEELRYRDDRQMGKVYLLRPGDRAKVPGLGKVGVDVLSGDFTREAFRALARRRRDQVKVFLLDRSALDALGNAYADEAMWAAGVHPKARVRELGDDQLDALHDAIVRVLADACAEVARREPPLDEKVRDFLSVRNRKGEACPRCGTTIRVCGVHGHDAFFCPQCQPDRKGRGFVDWRNVR